eukprot:2353796-Pleurochrysis_carterae.AAC.1
MVSTRRVFNLPDAGNGRSRESRAGIHAAKRRRWNQVQDAGGSAVGCLFRQRQGGGPLNHGLLRHVRRSRRRSRVEASTLHLAVMNGGRDRGRVAHRGRGDLSRRSARRDGTRRGARHTDVSGQLGSCRVVQGATLVSDRVASIVATWRCASRWRTARSRCARLERTTM